MFWLYFVALFPIALVLVLVLFDSPPRATMVLARP
jgi:hypothetical protein